MSTHNIGFHGEIRKQLFTIPLLSGTLKILINILKIVQLKLAFFLSKETIVKLLNVVNCKIDY